MESAPTAAPIGICLHPLHPPWVPRTASGAAGASPAATSVDVQYPDWSEREILACEPTEESNAPPLWSAPSLPSTNSLASLTAMRFLGSGRERGGRSRIDTYKTAQRCTYIRIGYNTRRPAEHSFATSNEIHTKNTQLAEPVYTQRKRLPATQQGTLPSARADV